MNGFIKSVVFAGVLAAAALPAFGQMPWASDIQQAAEAAARDNRLLLLHFYNDQCPPCERVEQQVFSQPAVAEAIGRNFVPVKIHAGQQRDLATRYQVRQWPTDIVCTPSGLEIYRTVSPQSAEAYVGFCNQVAQQAGVGASRNWQASMAQVGQATLNQPAQQAQNFANRMSQKAGNFLANASGAVQSHAAQAQTAVQSTADRAQTQTQQVTNQASQFVQRGQAAAQQAQQQVQAGAEQVGQQWNNATSQAANAAQQFQATAEQTAQNLRSQWVPPGGADVAPVQQELPQTSLYQPQPDIGPIAGPTTNPWVGPQQQAAPAQENPFAQAPIAAAPARETQLVPASQAPPLALEGHCPVTLLEQKQWKIGDAQFGAIHRGRTYLFVSATEQQRFLANPDQYSPVLSGYDPVRFAEGGQIVEGKRSFGITYQKQIYLFADEQSLQRFAQSPRAYATTAHQAMLRSDTAPTTYR